MLGVEEHLPGLGIADGLCREAALDTLGELLDNLAVLAELVDIDAVGSTAVRLADDDLLGDIHQTTGQVTRVGGTQSGIGQALTSATGGDEILQNAQAFTVVGLDGDLNGTAGGVGQQAAHAGQLTDLGHGADVYKRQPRNCGASAWMRPAQ